VFGAKNRDQQVAVTVMVAMAEGLRTGGTPQTPVTFQVVTPQPNTLGDGLGKYRLEISSGIQTTGLFALHDELMRPALTKEWAEFVILFTANSLAQGDLKVKMRTSGSTRSALVYFGLGKLAASVFAPTWIDSNLPANYPEVLSRLHDALVASTMAGPDAGRTRHSNLAVKDQRAHQSASTNSAAPPQLSPDGKWWWTGSEWIAASSISNAPSHRASSAGTQTDPPPRIDTNNLARQHHYIFAFRLLPEALFRDPTLLQGPAPDQRLLRVWEVAAIAARDFSRQSNVPDYVHRMDFNPIAPDGLKSTMISVAGKTAALIEMPTAIRPTEAIWALVIYDTKGGYPARPDSVGLRYFVLSRAAQALNNLPTNYIAEITPKSRSALGPVPRMEDAGTESADRATFRKMDRDMFIKMVDQALGGERLA
jgi:hypothetical protein